MTVDCLRQLARPDGERLLAEAADLGTDLAPWQVLERLRRTTSAELARAAVSLVEARAAAVPKFGDLAARLYLDGVGVQMATGLPVARHRASRFPQGAVVGDLTCGIGGDALALAARGPVVATDLDPARAWMARRNAEVAGLQRALVVARGDACQPAMRAEALFVEAARRTAGGRRRQHGADYGPPLHHVTQWRRRAAVLGVKVSPALDGSQWPTPVDEVELVSWRGQCREAVLWYGLGGGVRRRATVIDGGCLTWDSEDAPQAAVAPPGEYLYDPDPAVVRSHLVGLLAQQLGAWLVTEQVAYLSADRPTATPFARCFRVLRREAYGRRRVRQVLAAEGWRAHEILRRRFPVAPAQLARELRGATGAAAQPVSLVCTRVDERPVIFICEPIRQ